MSSAIRQSTETDDGFSGARFIYVKNFYSYSGLTPSAHNSAGKSKQGFSKNEINILRLSFSATAVNSIESYSLIRKYYNFMLWKKNKHIAELLWQGKLHRLFTLISKN